MPRLLFCLRRRPEMSREAFTRYWNLEHAQLVQTHASTLRIHRYAQLHSIDTPVGTVMRRARGAPEPFDGVAELWWRSPEDLEVDSPEVRAAAAELLSDERRFIDLARSPLWFVEDHPIFDMGG